MTKRMKYLVAASVCLAATMAVFAPLIEHLNSAVLTAEATDARNAIRGVWLIRHLGSTPFTIQRDPLNGAPEGVPLVPAVNMAAPIQPLFMWLLTPVFGLIGAQNVFLLIGVAATAFAGFLLLDRLGFGMLASLIGAYVIAFNPWAIERAVAGAPTFNHGWCLILLVAALLRLSERRTARAACLVGAAYACCFLLAPYLGLVGLSFILAWLIAELWRSRLQSLAYAIRQSITIGAVTLVPLMPALVVAILNRKVINQTLSNPIDEATQRAASPLASYLLPSPRHPIFGHWFQSLRPDDVLREKVLFFGFTTLIAATCALVAYARRRLPMTARQERALRLAVYTLPIAYLLSLPPRIGISGVTIYAPSYVISVFTTFYRVYARFGYAFGIAATILAVAALHQLERRRFGRVLVAVAGALIVFELLPGTIPVLAANRPPAYDAWIAKQPRGIVAHYPMPTDNELALLLVGDEYYNQRFTGQPNFALFGAGVGGTRESWIRLLARYVNAPLTPKILAAEGVRYVVVHDDVYRKLHETPPVLSPPVFRHLKTFGDVRIYEITPRPNPHFVDKLLLRNAPTLAALDGMQFGTVTTGPGGFYAPERYHNVFGWRWMSQVGVLRIHNPYRQPMKFRLIGHAFSAAVPRTIEVQTRSGQRLTVFRVPTYERGLAVKPLVFPPGDSELQLIADPPPQRLGVKDTRFGSIYLSPLRAVPIATTSLRAG